MAVSLTHARANMRRPFAILAEAERTAGSEPPNDGVNGGANTTTKPMPAAAAAVTHIRSRYPVQTTEASDAVRFQQAGRQSGGRWKPACELFRISRSGSSQMLEDRTRQLQHSASAVRRYHGRWYRR